MKFLVKENTKRCLLLIGLVYLFSSFTLLPIEKLKEKGILLSNNPGVYSKEIIIKSNELTDLKLYYTLNGNYPNRNDNEFNKPITIDTVKTILFSLYRNDKATDTFYCGTYIVKFKSVLPIVNITIPKVDLFDSTRGIYVGWMNDEMETFGNAWKDIEKSAFFEYFPNETPELSQQVGLKIFGGMTRQNREKSLRVIAKKKYGKGKFKYKVFPTKNIKSFNSLVLRTSGNDFNGTRFLDVMISSIAKDMNIDYLAYQPSVLFVNGEYWGIHNIREKSGKDYLEKNHDAKEDEIDLLLGEGYAEEGSSKDYKSFLNYLYKTPGTAEGFIDSVNKVIDVDNYINYSILQVYIVNPDSRGNVRYWRAKNLDNKFRWIYYDGDLSFYHYNHDFLKDRLSPIQTTWFNPTWANIILRRLVENPKIRDRFISSYCFMLSTVFESDSLQKRINHFKNLIKPEIGRHVKRRGFNYSVSSWESHVDRLLTFAKYRGDKAYLDIKSAFNLGASTSVQINTGIKEANAILGFNNHKVNTLLNIKIFQGIEFELNIQSFNPAYTFTKWNDEVKDKKRIISLKDSGNFKFEPIFEKRKNSTKKSIAKIIGVGFEKKKKIRFLVVEWDNKKNDSLLFCNESNSLYQNINSSAKNSLIFICTDTVSVKKDFPNLKSLFIQVDSLYDFVNNKNIYLIDSNGDIFDELDMKRFENKNPYFININNSWVGVEEKPEWENKFSNLIKEYKFPLIIITGLIIIVVGFFLYRRKKAKLITLLILFSSSGSLVAQSNQLTNYAKKDFNIEILKNEKLSATSMPELDSQFHFIKSYKKHSKPLTWISPFEASAVAWNKIDFPYQTSFYKENTNSSITHGRLKFSSTDVTLMISGNSYQSYLIDTLSKQYLVSIQHNNGTESWYYPIVPNKDIDVTKAGQHIGKSVNGFYWQLRFGTQSILPIGIIDNKGKPDTKGIFLENQTTTFISMKNRFDAFRKNYRNDIKSVQSIDYNKALQKELDGKNN
jgi:hypothetical protein